MHTNINIHAFWAQGTPPAPYRANFMRWQELLPGANFFAWRLDTLPQLRYPQLLAATQIYSAMANQVRLELLYRTPGFNVWMDYDVLPLRGFRETVEEASANSGFFACELYPSFFCNAVMGAQEGHPLLAAMLDEMAAAGTSTAGSALLTRTVRNAGVGVLPASAFYPHTPTDRARGVVMNPALYPDSFGVHLFDHNRTTRGEV